jgi:hypothetical protein
VHPRTGACGEEPPLLQQQLRAASARDRRI